VSDSHTYLNYSVEDLTGVGKAKSQVLASELSIYTFKDILEHYPFRYVDKTKISKISEIIDTSYIQVKGVISNLRTVPMKRGSRLVCSLKDESGQTELVWFQGASWIQKIIKPNTEYLVFGKPTEFRGQYNFTHPELEVFSSQVSLSKRIQAIYPSTEKLKKRGLDTRGIAKLIAEVWKGVGSENYQEFIPEELLNRYKIPNRLEAMKQVHFPSSDYEVDRAIKRLKFGELFSMQMKLLQLKVTRAAKLKGILFPEIGERFNTFYNDYLKFDLTGAQKRVLKEIRKDTMSGIQMNRLLQGDVGSGKTIVALLSMLIAIDCGYQAALMAPTEILAQQHYAGISADLKGLGIRVAILTGSIKASQKKETLKLLKNGDIDILIGTHALIEDTVMFQNLGIAVIDEQHRFGVEQRAKLWTKTDKPPHVLVMTATPIPRTLAMTIYGDLDVSVIDELPPGRKKIETHHYFDSKRNLVISKTKEQLKLNHQVYVVYPLIEFSDKLDLNYLMDGYEQMERMFPDYQVSIVHGQMKPEDKDYEMDRFVKGETKILVSTTVIEVGVNVPNASVMIIENAERFGLAQLHQLRGRVGRGADQSFCFLMTGIKLTKEGRKRMETMVRTTNGFEIAEVDMELRGAGDIDGKRQSGMASLKISNPISDMDILKVARMAAEEILEKDPELILAEHTNLKEFLDNDKRFRGLGWNMIA